MLIWISILLFIDAGFALWNEHRIALVLPRWNIKYLAVLEAITAIVLATFHFWRSNK